ncbi:hypothetical protein [uncultured Aquimarina sp.]|uniref:hypothetical protein n=1 Tax=uncultured Aquimarina sp. TaxID=575652 RepID=UPI0026332F59|nr:hypothetical protein [uncultured Aquimarina sp.]
MKTSNLFTELSINELTMFRGGNPTSSEDNTEGLPIVPFGDPSDWDDYFPQNPQP